MTEVDAIIDIGDLSFKVLQLTESGSARLTCVPNHFTLRASFVDFPFSFEPQHAAYVADYLPHLFGLESPPQLIEDWRAANHVQKVAKGTRTHLVFNLGLRDCKSIDCHRALLLALFHLANELLAPDQLRVAVVLPEYACEESSAFIAECLALMGRRLVAVRGSMATLRGYLRCKGWTGPSSSVVLSVGYLNLGVGVDGAQGFEATMHPFMGYSRLLARFRRELVKLNGEKVYAIDKVAFNEFFCSALQPETLNREARHTIDGVELAVDEKSFAQLVEEYAEEIAAQVRAVMPSCFVLVMGSARLEFFLNRLGALVGPEGHQVLADDNALNGFERGEEQFPPVEPSAELAATFQTITKLNLLHHRSSLRKLLEHFERRDPSFPTVRTVRADAELLGKVARQQKELERALAQPQIDSLRPFHACWSVLSLAETKLAGRAERESPSFDFGCFLEWMKLI